MSKGQTGHKPGVSRQKVVFFPQSEGLIQQTCLGYFRNPYDGEPLKQNSGNGIIFTENPQRKPFKVYFGELKVYFGDMAFTFEDFRK